jgi:hypothetical protein
VYGTEFAINFNAEVFPGKTLWDYNIRSINDVALVHRNIAGHTVLYLFMEFDTKAEANQYFRDYFAANPEAIRDYLVNYLDFAAPTSAIATSAAGNTYTYVGGSLALSAPSLGNMRTSTDNFSRMYRYLCRTLTTSTAPDPTKATPYDYYVNRDRVALLPDVTVFRDTTTNEVVALVNPNDVRIQTNTLLGMYPELAFIISEGDVDVTLRPFNGLIMSKKTIYMSADIHSDSDAVTRAARARNAAGQTFASYINGTKDDTDSIGSHTAPQWDYDALVYFNSWTRR